MRYIFFSLLVIVFVSCKDDDPNMVITDIRNHSWKLTQVNVVGLDTIIATSSNNISSYVLTFNFDTSFGFNTSVNVAGGTYDIDNNRYLKIFRYSEFSEACCSNEFDKKLLSVFPTASSYVVEGNNILKIEVDKGVCTFKRQ